MHEHAVAAALRRRVEALAERERAARVLCVDVRVGELSGLDADLLLGAWRRVCAEGPCAGAELRIERVPLRWICSACAQALEPGAPLRCPACGAAGELAGGAELRLERVDVEVA